MAVTILRQESSCLAGASQNAESSCYALRPGEKNEALEFLARRPIHTVFLATLIRDNGLVSPYNRGSFYGCRDQLGALEGVALIGHATVIETRTDEALEAFADLAGRLRNAYLIRGERKTVDRFWKHYADAGHEARLVCREMMFEKRDTSPGVEPIDGLRLATPGDVEHVMAQNALLAFEEGGINPLQRDPTGFRLRTERRIQQRRVWIWVHQGTPIFKADIVGDTPEMIYLEGIYVNPQERLKGYGRRCLVQLCSRLLERSQSICLTVNQLKANTVAFYVKAGFEFHSEYETIYLSQ